MTVSNVNDTTRSEYGESADSKSNPVGSAWVVEKLKNVVTNPEANATYGNRQNLFSMKVASLNATNGYNVVFSGIPEKADFYADNVTKTTTKVQVPVGYEFVNATEEPLYPVSYTHLDVYKRQEMHRTSTLSMWKSILTMVMQTESRDRATLAVLPED